MSNEYKDWIMELRTAPMGTREHNQWLCLLYPWLIPTNRITGEIIEDYNYEYTELDAMPGGWRKTFAEQLCAEINPLLKEANYEDQYHIVQIKDKFGRLHWYEGGVPDSIFNEYNRVLKKYEDLSETICMVCGAPATTNHVGFVVCEKCKEKLGPSEEEKEEN